MRPGPVFTFAFVVLAIAGTAKASETVGNPIVPTAVTDLCTDCGFIVGQAFSGPGTLTSYSFYNNGTGGDITPLLFTGVAGGYDLVGIGTQFTLAAGNAGAYTESFGLTSGTATVGSDSYFGFENTSGSLVAYSNTTPFLLNGGTAAYNPEVSLGSFIPVAGQTQDAYNEDLTRLYSVEATAVSATPEPSSLVLLGTGLAGFGAAVRRRFKK